MTPAAKMVILPLAFVFAATLAATSPAFARTWLVNTEGTGDAATIQAAFDSAAAGDTISLADGIFGGPGNGGVDCSTKAVTIISESRNPETCIITCYGSGQDCSDNSTAVHFRSTEPGAQRLEGVTITAWCGGVVCEAGSCPAIANCIFRDNWCMAAEIGNCGAGLRCLENSQPTITDCVFRDNAAMCGAGALSSSAFPVFTRVHFIENGGACGGGLASGGGFVTVIDCEFRGNAGGNPWNFSAGSGLCCGSGSVVNCVFGDNVSYGVGGGLCFAPQEEAEHLHVEGCTFFNNRSEESNLETGGGGLAVWNGWNVSSSSITIAGCTFVGNGAYETMYSGGGILLLGNVTAEITNTIIAFSGAGGAVACAAGTATLTLECCDLYGNTGGDWTGCLTGLGGGPGNFSALPLFCAREIGDLRLQSSSPCLPENHPSGYDCGGPIGAFGEGCAGGPSTEPSTWGAIKAIFR